jgi:NarL family two-component system response regulator YdfI
MRQNSTATSRQPIPGPAAIVIFCADQELRRNLTEALREDAAVAVVGVRDNASSLRELIDRVFPSAVLADAPPRELLAQWRRRHDQPRLIVLLENPEAEEGFEALEAGAHAILPRASPARDIISAIKTVGAGYLVVPPGLLSRLLAQSPMLDRSLKGKERPQLTPRELDVIAAMADGASNKAIARRLGISFHTVKFHVASVLAKLDADTRTEAVAKAAQLGLVML